MPCHYFCDNMKKKEEKKKWEDYAAESFFLFLKPLAIFSDWLADLIVTADVEIRRIEDLVVVLMVIIGLVAVTITIPVLDDMMVEKEDLSAIGNFTQCLTNRGVTLYSVSNITEYEKQREMFNTSFHYIVYVNCINETLKCNAEKIYEYPTWVIEGKKYIGVHTLNNLSALSGCEIR